MRGPPGNWRRARTEAELDHGDLVAIVFDHGGGPVFGEYLTTENRGSGRMMRIKRRDDGQHFHVSFGAEDVRVYRKPSDPDHGVGGFGDFELPGGVR